MTFLPRESRFSPAASDTRNALAISSTPDPTQRIFKTRSDLDVLGETQVAAREHHPKLVVPERVREKERVHGGPERPLALERATELRREPLRRALTPQDVDRAVLRGDDEERRVMPGDTPVAPHLEGVGERILDDVLREGEVLHTEDSRQDDHQAPRLAPKESIVEGYIFITGRTSTIPLCS